MRNILLFRTSSASKAKNVIQSILQVKPNKCLGCSARGIIDIREHEWFRSIDFDLLAEKQLPAPFLPEQPKEDFADSFEWTDVNPDIHDDLSLTEEEQHFWKKLMP